ncbi:MAG: DUF4058 family protein [Isosphaeraceae bacterium]
MPSPFPGMNPWLEQEALWLDFHTKFLVAINELLVSQVRPKYIVLVEQEIYVHEVAESRLMGRADLSLARTEGENGGAGTAVLQAPTEIQLTAQDVERVPYLEIRDRFGRDLVTVLEMLSPSNKRGDDRRQYLAKRNQLLESSSHLIEIDLLRGGRPMPDANRPDCAYSVLVSRTEDRPRCGFWPIGLKQRLPEIPIPLRQHDGDARVDLQEVLNRVYDVFGYEDFVYLGTPSPSLSPEDARWAQCVLGSERLP